MSGRAPVKSAFANLRPTILREPTRSTVSPEAEARLLSTGPVQIAAAAAPVATPALVAAPVTPPPAAPAPTAAQGREAPAITPPVYTGTLLQKKKRERLLLVSFRMPQSLKEKLEQAAKVHEINQTDLINEAIEMNLKRYI